MPRTSWSILRLAMLLMLILAACQSTATQEPASTSTPTADDSTLQAYPIATPYALEPAAGICASSAEELVVITLNTDMPEPRCSKVTASQKLTVVNKTLSTLHVSLGVFSNSLQPGTEYTLNVPFGEYLAPGVHQLKVSPCCGAEIWLESTP